MNFFGFNRFWFAIILIYLVGCDDTSGKIYEFSEPKNAVVNVTAKDEMIIVVCTFQAQKKFSKANDISDDKKAASILAQKALCRFYDLKQGEELRIMGMEFDRPVYFDNKVKISFQINKNNCEKVKSDSSKKDEKNEQ